MFGRTYDEVQEAVRQPELIEEMMKNERFVLPKRRVPAGFYALYDKRFEQVTMKRIDKDVHAIRSIFASGR